MLKKYILLPACIGLLAACIIIFIHDDQVEDLRYALASWLYPALATHNTPHGLNRSLAHFSFADAAEQAAPAVVNIYSSKLVTEAPNRWFDSPQMRRYFRFEDMPRRQRLYSSLGSGVIVDPRGYVLTNHHVVAGADEIIVALQDGREVFAQWIGSDEETDLAVLQIKLNPLPVITWSTMDQLRVGDTVLAIGNPFGVGQTVTKGIVSAKNRSGLQLSTFESFIQTDAAINPGNSGGALVDASGELVGINTALFSRTGGSQGIGFAVPAAIAQKVLNDMIQEGRVIRGWLGVFTQPSGPSAIGKATSQGLLIASIFKSSPAMEAGLRVGDVLTHINGKKIHSEQQSRQLIANYLPGTSITLTIKRNRKQMDVDLIIGQRPTLKHDP
jgi:serine protease DegS